MNEHSQYVIYGANGWMGRSAIDFISSLEPMIERHRLLLIGSRPANLEINQNLFEILGPAEGFSSIRENAIFFNAAFLRREALQRMSSEDYVRKNIAISELAIRAFNEKKPFCFINLSSGVVRDLDFPSKSKSFDEYSNLKKKLEHVYFDLGDRLKTPVVNCRIYSLSGEYLNEFNNLALSSFIRQAQTKNKIEVKSPLTKRTYVDAINLVEILFRIACSGRSINFDSGGTLISMASLAESVALTLGKVNCELILGKNVSRDYFGDYQNFDKIVSDLKLQLFGIEEQIQRTAKAFKHE